MALDESTKEGPSCDSRPRSPPGLQRPVVAAGEAGKELCQDQVDVICKDMIHRTDEMLQEKVDKMWTSAADQLKMLDLQQEQSNSSLEAELRTCNEKVKSLEVDKQEMQKSVAMLQEQLANLTAHLYGQQRCGWPNPGQMMMPGSPMMMAGMMGPFATAPSGYPSPPPFQMTPFDEASERSTTAPSSPLPPRLQSAPQSQPQTPSRGPFAPPSIAAPPPPPGLGAPPLPFAPPPPGLGGGCSILDMLAAKPLAPISLSAAIDAMDAKAGTVAPKSPPATMKEPRQYEHRPPLLQEVPKAQSSGNDAHSEALKFLQTHKDTPDIDYDTMGANYARGGRFGSPCSPSFGPSAAPRVGTLNLTPKRTPRLSQGRGTPLGMRSPSLTASPYVILESGGTEFGFTIRKADDCSLGLDVTHTDDINFLLVTGVKSGGAMEAWNKLCVGGPAAGKAVMPGDKIVKVNVATTPLEMLSECRDKKLLKFRIQRGEVDEDFEMIGLGDPAHHGDK